MTRPMNGSKGHTRDPSRLHDSGATHWIQSHPHFMDENTEARKFRVSPGATGPEKGRDCGLLTPTQVTQGRCQHSQRGYLMSNQFFPLRTAVPSRKEALCRPGTCPVWSQA